MIHPIPSGTRDVLPDEMRELRAITEGIRGVFSARGYGEVATPALEYEATLVRGDVLVLRSDMTIPIARVVASRYSTAEPPLRFCYFAHAYRSVQHGRGQPRELLQAGIELIGATGPEGTAEALAVLCEALAAAGLENWRVGLGDASLYPRLLDRLAVPEEARAQILHELVTRDYVGLAREVERFGAPELLELPQRRGGTEVLGAPETAQLAAVHALLPEAVADRMIFDLGLTRSLGYYTGAVFEVYDAALGTPLGGGGRYDDLLGRFGRELPACGWALDVERLHAARVGEGR
ncbi:MAG: ATP phosphoribosyltransferase regulatory subunit [Solirubrobacteraceae bacterium]